ncbi:MAG: response regulator [Candidatus Marinimicrobia bacterium]|jgi:DNA-binding response OmpR family regulator|nr:response regulator [Candidatus Neomarinimicrobiota bacterium]MCK9559382.1 response regulator [Candidatus Neomarinimicrobiota bacterium]MDD5061510.1 response regulator [Candidatus Neomarinimicrobiota bacterium]MDD5230806.1 response regulator [Candidatus Neomarinimicrobiota bacterium]
MAKVLIVDDDPDFVSAVAIVLENAGYKVCKAHSRQEGMQVFDKEQPNLVVLDVMMQEPDDGFVMAQELKARAKVPILMLTSVGQVTGLDFDKDSEMVPVDVFEQKPIMPSVLLERINQLLQ